MVIFSASVFSNEIQSPCYVRWLKMKSTTLLQSLYNVVLCHKPIFCVAHPCFVQWAKMYFFGKNSTACLWTHIAPLRLRCMFKLEIEIFHTFEYKSLTTNDKNMMLISKRSPASALKNCVSEFWYLDSKIFYRPLNL